MARFSSATTRTLLALLLLSLLATTNPMCVSADEGDTPTVQQLVDGDGTTVYGYLWYDANCDGIRQSTESAMTDNPRGSQMMSLYYVGTDNTPFTMDDKEIGLSGPLNGNIHYAFRDGGMDHTYFIVIRPQYVPAGYRPAPYQQGSDRTIDNDLTVWERGIWATGTFVIPKGTGFYQGPPAIQGIDIGLCAVVYNHSVMLPMAMK